MTNFADFGLLNFETEVLLDRTGNVLFLEFFVLGRNLFLEIEALAVEGVAQGDEELVRVLHLVTLELLKNK